MAARRAEKQEPTIVAEIYVLAMAYVHWTTIDFRFCADTVVVRNDAYVDGA